jgi:hypothetical protein
MKIWPGNGNAQGKRVAKGMVVEAYRGILGRDPESEAVIAEHQVRGTLGAIIEALLASDEFHQKSQLQFPKHDRINALDLLKKYAVGHRHFRSGYITNFIDVYTDVRYCDWTQEGVEPSLPIPGNFHATFTEWAAVLRAIDLARDAFTVIELGAGWGCWMVNSAVAAKHRGLIVKAIGVEGNDTHIDFMKQHSHNNGLTSDEIVIRHAVAWGESGYAAFPKSNDANAAYGQEPRFFKQYEDAVSSIDLTKFDLLEALSLNDIAPHQSRVDLLHVDIQGGEEFLIRQSRQFVQENVAYLVVGTHGRQIEGKIIDMLCQDGWILEIEEPCTLPLPLEDNVPYIDGLQGWRNPRLTF